MSERILKFRAWDLKKRQMIYSNGYKRFGWINHEFDKTAVSYGGGEVSLSTDPARFKWMQFTGLLDRNGQEIFESDILEYSYRRDRHEAPTTYRETVEWEEAAEGCGFAIHVGTDHLVIGNIHEHPELLNPAPAE